MLGFDTRWDDVLLSINETPSGRILDSIFRILLKESDQVRNVFAICDLDILWKDMPQSYRRLKSMVKRLLDPKSKALNFEARNERTVTWHRRKAMAKGSPSGLSENMEKCYQRKAKGKCTRKDACSFRHDSHKSGASTRSSSPAPRSQTNSEGKSSSKGRPPRGSSPSGERLQKPCIDSLKCNRTNRACNLCHPSVKITNHSQAACLAKSVPCYTGKRDRQPKKARRAEKEMSQLFGLGSNWDVYLKMRNRRNSNRVCGWAPIH